MSENVKKILKISVFRLMTQPEGERETLEEK
jgi:hypothetical protein